MNLIRDPWIPVICASGHAKMIAPWQITNFQGDVPVSFQGPRTDFNGIYAQFLIGLLQTVYSPAGKQEWRKGFRDVPVAEHLKEVFDPYSHYFNLFDGSCPFMQDTSVDTSGGVPVGRLLLEMPGENAEKNNTDHFLKRHDISGICPVCAAAAVYSLQTNASFGGAGHRVALRGGGPLTTLVKGRTLWELLWLNVLSSDQFEGLGSPEKNTPQEIFPWVGEGKEWRVGRTCTPADVHPAHMFWGTPRRILLKDDPVSGECDICGAHSDTLITTFFTEKNGIVYSGGWMHPLSPHRRDKKTGAPFPEHMQPGGITYHDWLGLIQNHPDLGTEPAAVVTRFRNYGPSALKEVFGTGYVPLWSFGYDMDKAKARCYYEGFMPIPLVPEEKREEYDLLVSRCLLAGDLLLWFTKDALKKAWYRSPKDAPSGDMTHIDLRFWQDTESLFYQILGEAWKSDLSPESCDTLKNEWRKGLRAAGLRIFDNYSQYEMIDHSDPRRIALARKYYLMASGEHSKKIQSLLMLSGAETDSNQSGRRKRKNTEID